MRTFKVHLFGNLLPAEGARTEFLQIFFLSYEDKVSLHSNLNTTLQKTLISRSASILHMGKKQIFQKEAWARC